MSPVIIRIALRYIAGALVAKGFFAPADGLDLATDPELIQSLQVGVGLVIAAASEAFYILARKYGWAK